MPKTRQPAVDLAEDHGPPSALQDTVNVAVVLGAFALIGLGTSFAFNTLSPAPAGEARAVARPGLTGREEARRQAPPAAAVALGRRLPR